MTFKSFKIFTDQDESILIQRALEYIPEEVHTDIPETAIYTTTTRFGIVLGPDIRKKYEVVMLSDKIIPPSGTPDADRFFRFFVFTVLHEVAHIFGCNSESDADETAMSWYNKHISEINSDLPDFDTVEKYAIEDIMLKREWIFVSQKGDSNQYISGCIGSVLVNDFLDYCEREDKKVSSTIRSLINEVFLER